MIVRMWRGKVRKDLKTEYVAYLKQTGLADCGKADGNLGVYLLCQDLGDAAKFLTMTFWTSIAAIKKIAGEDHEKARYYPEDQKYLLNFSENAEHFEVLYDGTKDSNQRISSQRETWGREVAWIPAFRLRLMGFGGQVDGQVSRMTESGKHQRDSGLRQDDRALVTTPHKQIFTTKHGAADSPRQFTPN